MPHALIFEGKVVQIEATPFEVAPALKWVDLAGVNPKPGCGWTYDGQTFAAPPVPPAPPKHPLLAKIDAVLGDSAVPQSVKDLCAAWKKTL